MFVIVFIYHFVHHISHCKYCTYFKLRILTYILTLYMYMCSFVHAFPSYTFKSASTHTPFHLLPLRSIVRLKHYTKSKVKGKKICIRCYGLMHTFYDRFKNYINYSLHSHLNFFLFLHSTFKGLSISLHLRNISINHPSQAVPSVLIQMLYRKSKEDGCALIK